VLYLIPLFPLLGFVVNAALGKRLPKAVSGLLARARWRSPSASPSRRR
jgi:hypothetical protein